MTVKGPNLLDLVPRRTKDFKELDDGRVEVLIPRFGGGRTAWLLGRLSRSGPIRLRLDDVGTAVWRLCDGRRSVHDIGLSLRDQFGDRIEPVYERLAAFIKQMKKAGLVDWR